MSILSTITSGIDATDGKRIVIAGQEKMGKTTLVCGSPKPLLIPLEVGYGGVAIQKTKMIQSYSELNTLMEEIKAYCKAQQFPFSSIIFDSATALERHIHQQVIESDPTWLKSNKSLTMATAHGGYGKAYIAANELFNSFLKTCDELATVHKLNIIFTCHVFSADIEDPMFGNYHSWDLLLHSPKDQKSYGKREMLTQWADVVGFLHEPVSISNNNGQTLGYVKQEGRLLGLSRMPQYVAGNRYQYQGTVQIPQENGWNHLAQALYESRGIDIFSR